MELKNKLKQLRVIEGMTQEEVANRLGVSSQTVSKWERGLLYPDITLLPKIALLFKCSIDSLFDMELVWGIEHRREFEERLHALHEQKDWEGVYQAWLREIELNPDHYENYPDVMLHVLRKKLWDEKHVKQMISLADHAERRCTKDDIRNEIFRLMLQICAKSDDREIRKKGEYYHRKLPKLRHSREIYAKFVMEDEEYRKQLLENILYLTDLTECSIRQLILPEMQPTEKLFYYQKAASLYETLLDGKYGGFYDPALMSDYLQIAIIYMELGQEEQADEYVHRILRMLEKHLNDEEKADTSKLLYSPNLPNTASTEENCKKILQGMRNTPSLAPFKQDVSNMLQRWKEHHQNK